MMIDPIASLQSATSSFAAGAVQSSSQIGASSAITGFVQPAGGMDFSDVLGQVVANGVQTIKSAEATSIMGLKGQASVQQVVEAVMSAEQSLQTALAVRDKVVAAYQEISRMQI
jgi:flagellar hook-basal body complex protein FliE